MAAFSSFFLSLKALPPCRRSRPLIDLAKLECTPGDCGVKEYSDCGAEGSTACELEAADDSGRPFSAVFFCLDKKYGRCFSLSCAVEVDVVAPGTRVEVEALAAEYNEEALDIVESTRLVVDALAKLGLNTPLLGEGKGGL